MNSRMQDYTTPETTSPSDFGTESCSNGFSNDNMTLTFMRHPHCCESLTHLVNGLPSHVLYNTDHLIAYSLDEVITISEDDNTGLYIPINSPAGIENLYRVIDSPTLQYNKSTNKVEELKQYYFDKRTNVCVSIDMRYDHKNGYHLVRSMYATREPNKINRVNSFIYSWCTRSPRDIPEGVSSKRLAIF